MIISNVHERPMKLLYKHFVLLIQEIKDIILNFMESPRLRAGDPPNRSTCKINGKKTRTDPPPPPKHRINYLFCWQSSNLKNN